MTRIILSILRLFSVYTYLKDAAGGRNWQRRRFWVEMTVALKIGMAVLVGYLLVHCSQAAAGAPGGLLRFILCYNLADTITYPDLPDPYGGYPEAFRQRDPFHAASPAELCGSVD